ncbi:MAG TPA: hypothetical protein VKU85_06135 [bacterium]|nr:hypothetical protein [bacterium]
MFRKAGVCPVAATAAFILAAGCQSDVGNPSAEAEGAQSGFSILEDEPDAVTVPHGTTFIVTMDTSLSTDESAPGDPFLAHVEEPLRADGRIVVPAGALVRGSVSRVSTEEETSMTLAFTEIESSGETYPIDVQPIELIAEPSGPSDAAVVLGAGAAGAVIGAAIDGGKGAAIGGVGGVTAGTIAVMVRGSDVEVPAGQRIALLLESSAELPARG